MKTSTLDVGLIVVGALLISIGAYRVFPPTIDRKFLWNIGPMAIALIVILGLTIHSGGMKYLQSGIDGTTMMTSQFMPTLILLMPVIGFSLPLAKHFETTICSALEGPFGYLWALISAGGSPSGNAFAGVVRRIWPTQPMLRPLLLYFLTVVPLVSFTIYYIRQIGLGLEIAREMYRVNWYVAIWLIPGFWLYGKFFYAK